MTREEMIKRSWKPYQTIIYTTPRSKEQFEMLLLAIDFEKEVVTCSPLDTESYENEEFVISVSNISLPRRGLKVAYSKFKTGRYLD